MPVGKADLHVHTRVSDGMASVERVLEYAEHETDLDVIAITDHEDVAGGLRAQEVAAKRGYAVEVIAGAEVTTLGGHLVGLFIESTPPSFKSVERTLEAIHAQGGLAIVPHPMSWLTRSISRRTLDRIQGRGEAGVTFDAIELANPSPAGLQTRKKAAARNAGLWRLAEVGGSDAHHLPHLGTGWTEFPGRTAEELRLAILGGATRGRETVYPSIREVGVGNLLAGLAWGYAATPRKMMRRVLPGGVA